MDGIDGVLIHFALRMIYPKSLCGLSGIAPDLRVGSIRLHIPHAGQG
jgi:hypothetical protein